MPSSSATAWARTGWARPETRTRCFSPWLVMPVIFGGLLRGSGWLVGGCRTGAGSGVPVGVVRFFAALLGAGGFIGALGGLGGRSAGAARDGPPLEDALRATADGERPGGHVTADHGAGSGVSSVAHLHRGDEHVVRPGAGVG